MGQVFISYAREDEIIARHLYDYLKGRGGKPYLDRIHLIGGQDWRKAIEKAMDDSMHVIVLMSEHSMAKGKWREVQREIKIALSERRKKHPGKTYVIPVRLDQSDAGGFINRLKGLSDLEGIHWIEWSDLKSKDQIWTALVDPTLHPE